MASRRPTWLLLAALVVIVLLVVERNGDQVKPVPRPPADAPDLLPAFSATDDLLQAKQDASDFAALCCALADQLEYDSKLPSPRINTGVQMDDMRRWAREYFLSGQSLGVRYPKLRDIVKDYLDRKLGTDGGRLDDAKRKAWIDALRVLAEAGRYAASRL